MSHKKKTEIAIDHLTMLDVSPPDMITLAREAGFDSAGLRVSTVTPSEEPWPMHPGSPMLKETLRRMDDTGMKVLDVEVIRLDADTTREDYAAALEVGGILGARFVTVNSDDPEPRRAAEKFAALVEEARQYGVRPLIEAIPYTETSDLGKSVRIAEASGGGGILLDALHFRRYGGSLDELRSLGAGLIGYVQVCDGPLEAPTGLRRPESLPRNQATDGTDLQLESRAARMLPGDGELPLEEFLGALPDSIPVSIEAPAWELRTRMDAQEFARRACDSVRRLVESG